MGGIHGEASNPADENRRGSFINDATMAKLSSINQNSGNVAPVSSGVNVNAVPSLPGAQDILSSFNRLDIGSSSRNIPAFIDANATGGFSPLCNSPVRARNSAYVDWSINQNLVHQTQYQSYLLRRPPAEASVHQTQYQSYLLRRPPAEASVQPQNHQGMYKYINPSWYTGTSTFLGGNPNGAVCTYQNSIVPSHLSGIHQNARYSYDYMDVSRMRPRSARMDVALLDDQLTLSEGNPEVIQNIFLEIKDRIRDLMADHRGGLFVQKFITECNVEQMVGLMINVFFYDRGLLSICKHQQGTRALQKMLEYLTTTGCQSPALIALKRQALTALSRLTLLLSKGVNSHHVIIYCLIHFSGEETSAMQFVLANHCLELATDKSGCCVLQKCVEYKHGQYCNSILAQLAANALFLSEHPYGNYVVSLLLKTERLSHIKSEILSQLKGSYVSLSMNRHASNVVEECLEQTRGNQQDQIIIEMMNDQNFLRLLQDPYGNFVAQAALRVSTDRLRRQLVNRILMHFQYLQSHPYGKRVFAKAKESLRRV